MVVNCHYHLDERLITIDALGKRLVHACGVHKAALKGALCDPFPERRPALLGLLRFHLSLVRLKNLARRMHATLTPSGELRLPHRIIRRHAQPDNRPVFEIIRAHPDTYLGGVFVNPTGGTFGRVAPDNTFDYGRIKRRIEALTRDSGVRRRLLGDNFMHITS